MKDRCSARNLFPVFFVCFIVKGWKSMLRRAMVIYRLSLLSFIHRLRHDFARELVIGFCGFILLSLFYYIFNDFLNEEVKNISGPMRQFFAEILAYVLTGIGMVAVIRMIRNELSDPRSHGRSFAQLGESRSVIFLYLCLRIPSLILDDFWIWFLMNFAWNCSRCCWRSRLTVGM